jgi:hypothetical protein
MKASLVVLSVLFGTLISQAAYPQVEILRPNSSDRLQPGTPFRMQWRVLGTNDLDHGDWNLFFDTNLVQVGRLVATAVYEGGGNWHADILIPNEIHPFTVWDETLVPLPTGCSYTLHIHEDVTEADGRSATFCLGVPQGSINVSQVQVCWNSRSNRVYQVQFRSPLTGNAWTSLGATVQGNGSTNCVTDTVTPGQPQKFYRVEEVP